MQIETKYNLGDEIKTKLGDVGIIVEIYIRYGGQLYTVRHSVDKYLYLSDEQIEGLNINTTNLSHNK